MDASPRRGRRPSPLTRRILAVNVTALVILAAGVVSLVDYRRELVAAELAVLHAEAERLAGALADAAVSAEAGETPAILAGAAQTIIRRLTASIDQRVRLYGADGTLLVDTRRLTGPGGEVTIGALPPPRAEATDRIGDLLAAFDRLAAALSGGDGSTTAAGDIDGVAAALAGRSVQRVEPGDGGPGDLLAAVPLSRFGRTAGAVVVGRSTRPIDAAVLQARVAVLRLVGVTLAVTVLVSLYLSQTIVRPLKRLAGAAERVRRDGTTADLPDFAGRRDEIGDLAAVLREMVAALGRRMDAMERFAGDVSHEIKNPLGSIRSAVDAAARTGDAAQLRTLFGIIEDDVRRLDRLVTDIADASRLDVELARARAQPVDLAGLLAALVEVAGPAAAERGVELTAATPPATPLLVAGIDSRLMQVFDNIVANAVSFSPPGGRVRVAAAATDGEVRVTIDDDGPGVPEEACERIFERFYSQRPAGEARGAHSGLGLGIVRQIVEAFGGTVHAENRRDPAGGIAGARFVVRLPRHPNVDRPRPGHHASSA